MSDVTHEQQPLLHWMNRLYEVTADPPNTFVGDLGVWPLELRPLLELVCRAHAPSVDDWHEQPAVTLAKGLLTPPRNPIPAPAQNEKPLCWLFFSGGKDSLAAGMLAERAGYRVRAIFVRKVNHSYPLEEPQAQAIAELMGWSFIAISPQLPSVPKRPDGISVVRNPYLLATALHQLCEEQGEPVLAAYAFGGYAIDDCHNATHVSEFEVTYRQMAALLTMVYPTGGAPQRLRNLADPVEAFTLWRTLPKDVRALTASCLMPLRNKPLHRRRNLALGAPLLDYECGSCYKCCEKAVLLSDARVGLPDGDAPYPAAYLTYARARVATLLAQPISGVHAHSSLVTPYLAEIGYSGSSMQYLWERVFDGKLPRPSGQCEAPPTARTVPATELRVKVSKSPANMKTPTDLPKLFRDRVLRLERVRASALVPNPKNFRQHPAEQREAYRSIAAEIGFAGAELVRILPDGRYMLVDGHLRQEDALEQGDPLLPVLVTDLTAAEADALLATYDPIARLATIDQQAAERLVSGLRASEQQQVAGLLEQVAAHERQVAALLAGAQASTAIAPADRAITDGADDEWPDEADDEDDEQPARSMELKQPKDGELGSGYRLLVECQSEGDQRRAYELLTAQGYQCRVLTL